MKYTLANQKKWSGFRFTAYSLDLKVLELPLNERRRLDGKIENIQTKVGEVYDHLADRSVEVEDGVLEVEVKTETEELSFSGPQFNHGLLSELLKVRKTGANPFSADWYLYDSDSSTDQPNDLYTFFVVCDGKIVREDVSIRDYPGSGFDPSLFVAEHYSFLDRSREASWRRALTKFWYRKFYTENRIGQLMVLCNPQLSGRWGLDATARLLRHIYILLWVLIALVGLVFLRLSR